ETVEARVAALQPGHHRQCLGVVVESAMKCEALVEGALARMAERWMTEIVGESTGLREIFVEAKRPSKRASDLGNLKGVGQAGAIVVALVVDEHLGLVGKPPKRRGMNDSVAVAAELVAGRARRLAMKTAATRGRIRREGRPLPTRIHCHVPTML